MAEAGLNTLMGMLIVFLALIFISFVIRLFGYIPELQKNLKKKKEEPAASVGINNAVEMITANEEELVDDTELVAVITAAIMAAMGDEAPSDGLIVRSIKKRRAFR